MQTFLPLHRSMLLIYTDKFSLERNIKANEITYCSYPTHVSVTLCQIVDKKSREIKVKKTVSLLQYILTMTVLFDSPGVDSVGESSKMGVCASNGAL